MITVREFRNIINKCPNDWTITLIKWEHGTKEEIRRKHPFYPMSSLISVSIQDIVYRRTDDGDVIYKIILKENFDDKFTMSPHDMRKIFCGTKDDYDLLDFVLCIKDNYIHLNVEAGDMGYSDKSMSINLEEQQD